MTSNKTYSSLGLLAWPILVMISTPHCDNPFKNEYMFDVAKSLALYPRTHRTLLQWSTIRLSHQIWFHPMPLLSRVIVESLINFNLWIKFSPNNHLNYFFFIITSPTSLSLGELVDNTILFSQNMNHDQDCVLVTSSVKLDSFKQFIVLNILYEKPATTLLCVHDCHK